MPRLYTVLYIGDRRGQPWKVIGTITKEVAVDILNKYDGYRGQLEYDNGFAQLDGEDGEYMAIPHDVPAISVPDLLTKMGYQTPEESAAEDARDKEELDREERDNADREDLGDE